MDLNYSYSLISFGVGILSGFQFIAERHRRSPFRAASTGAGVSYLALRGLIASIAFVALYAYSIVQNRLVLWALITGAGAEVILRTKVFIHEQKNPGGGVEEVMLGPLNLLVSFQNFFLARIEEEPTPLELTQTKAEAQEKIKFMKANVPDGSFEDFCRTVENHLGGYGPQSRVARDIRAKIRKLRKAHAKCVQAEDTSTICDERFKYTLGYTLLDHDHFDKEGFLMLMSKVSRNIGRAD